VIIFGGAAAAANIYNDVYKLDTIDCTANTQCPDGNLCTIDGCRVGSCIYSYEQAGTPCNDTIFCNGLDTCDANGVCTHLGDPCMGGLPCQNRCNETFPSCNNPPEDSCDDGAFCTSNDKCDGGGSCMGGPDPCTTSICLSTCDETADNCNTPAGVACTDGLYCTLQDVCDGVGNCVGSGDPCPGGCRSCSEGNSSFVCASPAGTPCDNNIYCDGVDTCDGVGNCISPGNPCVTAGCPDGCDDDLDYCKCTTNPPGGAVGDASPVSYALVLIVGTLMSLLYL